MNLTLDNRIVFVTGANRGIGKAIVEEAIQRGAAKVYAAVRNVETISPRIAEHGKRIVAVPVDLHDTLSINAAAKLASDAQIVVNNAGVMQVKSVLEDGAIDSLRHEIDVNVFGLIRIVKAFAPVLKANGGGAFVQLNSVASLRASENFATYCASKAASYSITQGLKDSLVDQGTHVVSVHPGPTQTDMGTAAGFGDFATPAEDVATAIFDAIDTNEFHCWVGPLAKLVGQSFSDFSNEVIEGDMKVLRQRAFGI